MPVVNLEDGSRLSGDEAPSKKDLDRWLDLHPNYMVEQDDQDKDPSESHSRKKKRLDPNKLDLQISYWRGECLSNTQGYWQEGIVNKFVFYFVYGFSNFQGKT